MSDALISAEKLCAGYTYPVLKDVSFSVRGGEIAAVIGPNGGGKSTLIKTLAGGIKRLGGKIYICSTDADKIKPREKAKIISVLLTERIGGEKMTCREVVETGRYPYTGYFGVLSRSDRAKVLDAMELVGVGGLSEKDFSAVSDGQRQMVMLARAIAQEARILLLDEPTSYLDIRHKLAFLEVLRTLADEKKIAVILSMHEVDLAKKAADNALCIKEGRVRREGPPEEIFKGETICELFDLNEKLYKKYFERKKDDEEN